MDGGPFWSGSTLPHVDSVLPLAFAEAAARKAKLTSIQVSMTSYADNGPLPWTVGLAAAAHGLAASVSDALERWAARFPEVLVNHLTIPGDAFGVLRDASEAAELLIIGRHDGREHEPRSLGSQARQLINTARCPVLVAAPTRIDIGADHSGFAR